MGTVIVWVSLSLAVLAALEASVHLMRIRSATHHSWFYSANMTLAVSVLRLSSLGSLAVALDRSVEAGLIGGVAYCASAWVTTAVLHRWLERRRRERAAAERKVGLEISRLFPSADILADYRFSDGRAACGPSGVRRR